MLRALSIAATFLAAGCPSHGPTSYPTPVDETPVRIQIARAEVKRAGGVEELAKLVATGTPATKALALRGLGRIGGDAALAVLKAHLGDAELGVNRAIHHRDAGLLAVGNDLLQADLAVAQKRHKRNEHGISIRRMIRLVLPCSVHAN